MEDPSQLEDAITILVSDLSSPISEDRLPASPVPNEQYAKAAMISQHLPPAVAQARKLGIEKIDHYLMVQGKGSRNQKQESKTNNNKHTDSDRQENSRSSGKTTITLHEVSKQTPNLHDSAQDNQNSPQITNIIATNESTVESCINTQRDTGASHLEISQNVDILSPGVVVKEPITTVSSSRALCENNPCNIKVEPNVTFIDKNL